MATAAPDPHFPFARPRDVEPAVEYAELRKTNPISQVELWDGSHPFLLVKHKDITQVLTDDRLSKQRQRAGFPEMTAGGKAAAKNKPTFVDMDPPEHGKQREMVEPIFTKESVDNMRPHIQKTVDDLLDAMLKAGGKEPVDLVEKFAHPIPSYIIYGILGVPFKDLEFLTQQNAYGHGLRILPQALTSLASVPTAPPPPPKHPTQTKSSSTISPVSSTSAARKQKTTSSPNSSSNKSNLVF